MLNQQQKLLFDAQAMVAVARDSGVCSDVEAMTTLVAQLAALDVDVPAQVVTMLDAVRALYLAGRPTSALEVATQAISLTKRSGDAAGEIMATTMVGICSADTGNLPAAMEAHSRALTMTQATGDQFQEVKVWINLSTALGYSGLYREASDALRRALEVAATCEAASPLLAAAYANLAMCHLNLTEPTQGLHAIQRALAISSEPTDVMSLHNRVLAESHYTRLLIDAEDYEAAKTHADSAKRYAGLSQSTRTEIVANVALGLAEVFIGAADQGVTRLTGALIQASAARLSTREVLVALVRANEHLQRNAQALLYLQQMLEAQQMTQSANILKHVARHLEQLHHEGNSAYFEDGKQVIKRLAQHAELIEGRAAKAELGLTKEQLFSVRVDLLERLAVTTELRDDSTGEHAYRVGKLAALLAKAANCPPDFVEMMDIAGRLHDIGKIGIPDGVLLKAAKFNDAERTVMEEHARIGGELLQKSQIPEIQIASDIAHYHHERWDGKGYPSKRAGEDIPLCARIAAIADVFDALSHARSYKPAWSLETTLNEIRGGRGTQFDPKLTDIFLKMMDELIAEHGTAAALDEFLGAHARTTAFYHSRHDIMENIYGARRQFPAEVKEEAGAAVVAADKKTP